MKNYLSLFLVLLVAQESFALPLVWSEWFMPTRGLLDRFEMLPHERTRPVVQGDIIYYANLYGDVYATHRTDGYVLWHRRLPAGVDGALTLARSRIYVGDTHGNLWALNARDGSDAWEEPFKIQSEWLSPPTAHKDLVLAMSGAEDLYAISESKGKEVWHYSHRGDEKMTVRGTASPTVYGTDVYQGFADGYLIALQVKDGVVLWSKKLKSKERFYDVDATAFADDSQVIASSYDGKLYSLKRLDGEISWVFPVGSYAGFLVEDKNLYFSGLNSTFYALDRTTGAVIWKTPFEKGVGFAPTRVSDYLVMTTSSDPAYVINPTDGSIVGKESLGAGAMTSAASVQSKEDNWFYCMSNYGNLSSYQISQGSLGAQEKIVKGPSISGNR